MEDILKLLNIPKDVVEFEPLSPGVSEYINGLLEQRYDPETGTTKYVVNYNPKDPGSIPHELCHVAFRLNGEKTYKELEEATCRIFEYAYIGEELHTCNPNTQMDVKVFERLCTHPKLRKSIVNECVGRLYASIYLSECVMPEDQEVIQKVYEVAKGGNVIEAYNILAKYCGVNEIQEF